jgi:hypothetical protein
MSGFEPLPSGPRPVTNRSRRNGVGSGPYVGDYTNPILMPEAVEVVRKYAEIELSGLAHPTPSNHCWPSGIPYIFLPTWRADITAAGQGHVPLPPGS